MEDTKVQIGDDCLLDLGVNSEWYISTLSYDNESVSVELRRKADRYSEWWRAEQTEPNVVMPKKCKGCDSASKIIEAYSRGYIDGADAVKAMPQTFTADGIVFAKMTEAEQTEPMIYPQVDGITPSVIQKVGYATDSVTGEILGMTLDTDCSWK